jgi:hypothetical protein
MNCIKELISQDLKNRFNFHKKVNFLEKVMIG